jgi:hypothetical protein
LLRRHFAMQHHVGKIKQYETRTSPHTSKQKRILNGFALRPPSRAGWRFPIDCLESAGEMPGAGKAGGIGDLGDGKRALLQQAPAVREADYAIAIEETLPAMGYEEPAEMARADAG